MDPGCGLQGCGSGCRLQVAGLRSLMQVAGCRVVDPAGFDSDLDPDPTLKNSRILPNIELHRLLDSFDIKVNILILYNFSQ